MAFPSECSKQNIEEKDKTQTKNTGKMLDYAPVGFSTTQYKSFPAWLNDIRQDTNKPSKDKKALSSISDEDL